MKHFSELSPTASRVVDVAEALIQRQGYSGFSIDDVAVEVGIKKPSVHHHFATKSGLVCTVVERYTHRFGAELSRIAAIHGKATARLKAYVELFASTFAQDRRLCVCGMLGAESDSLPAEVVAQVDQFFRVNLDWLATTIADGQHAGLLRRKPAAAALAAAFLSALEGAMVMGRGTQGLHGPTEIGHTVLALVLA